MSKEPEKEEQSKYKARWRKGIINIESRHPKQKNEKTETYKKWNQ